MIGVDLVTGTITSPTHTTAPAPAPDPTLAEALGATPLGFPSERAQGFALGTGPKARWLVNEVYPAAPDSPDASLDLIAKTHIYDAATHRHLGVVTQEHLYDAPQLEWVTDRCALVSRPFPHVGEARQRGARRRDAERPRARELRHP